MEKDRTLNAESLIQAAKGSSNTSKTFLEVLHNTFSGSDLVTIKNVMDHDTGWVYVDPKEEKVDQPDRTTRRVTWGEPKAKVLKPGETITIPGWQAFVALDRLYKEYAQQDASTMGFKLSSVDEMENFLSDAYVGIFDPNSANTSKVKPVQPKAEEVEDQDDGLGLLEDSKKTKK